MINVGLVQINNSFSGQNYLPYAAGMLQAYAQANADDPSRFQFLLPIYSRIPVEQAVAQLMDADVVGFSAYVWNIRISLEIAKRLKAAKPDVLIIFGGPQVPDRPEEFLRQNPFIDLTVHGEGEAVFLSALNAAETRAWDGIPSVGHLDKHSHLQLRPKAKRSNELARFPSPFLNGTFEPLMLANPNEQWLALWETNRGCPFGCTFCDWGSAVQSKVYTFEMERLEREMDWFADHQIEFIFCCDANFGILPRDVEIAQYAAAKKAQTGYPHALSVQNTKNATDRAYQVQKILSDAGLNKGVTISFQSVDERTLASIKRKNISTDSFKELQRRFTQDGVETYSDVILGLPGETYDSFVDGVSAIIENGQHNRIQFNNLAILPNAEMADPAYRETYGLRSVETKIINIHGALSESAAEIPEMQELVIGTKDTPPEDWVKTRAFAWTAGLLHFDKVFQIPLVIAREQTGLSYRTLIEAFARPGSSPSPALDEMREFFLCKARDIQLGGPEYCQGGRWLNIWWPTDEYVLIQLCYDGKLDAFYSEAKARLLETIQAHGKSIATDLIDESVLLNQALLKQPFIDTDIEVEASSNLWDYYRAVALNQPCALVHEPVIHRINRTSERWTSWDEWCREVVWYGNKKGAYLYGNHTLHRELAGHY